MKTITQTITSKPAFVRPSERPDFVPANATTEELFPGIEAFRREYVRQVRR